MNSFDHEKIKQGVQLLLEGIGEDPRREGLLETPDRVSRFYKEIFSGLNKPSHTYLDTSFTDDHEELVLVKDISFFFRM